MMKDSAVTIKVEVQMLTPEVLQATVLSWEKVLVLKENIDDAF